MASDFLKKKAQEQAESVTKRFGEDAYGGTKWRESWQETNGKEGGNKPSSTQSNRYESTRASSFLSKKAEEQAASVTERFGEDAYGGTKWRSENSALSSGALSQLLQQVQGLGTPGATADTKRTSGGYYSRPVAPEGVEDIYNAVSYLTPALREAAIPVTVAQEGLQATEADLQIVGDYLQRAMEAYNKNPSAPNANTYNQIVAKYDEIYQEYTAAYDAYNAVYNKYKSTEDQAAQILNAYQSYSTAQQAAYDDWRGTIRDAASIEADLKSIESRIETQKGLDEVAAAEEAARKQAEYQARQDAKPWYEKLAGYLGGAQDTTLPTATVTQGMVQDALTPEPAKASAAMQALLDEKALLNEELDWSNYFFYNDYRDAADFESLSRYIPQNRTEQRAIDIMLDNYSEGSSGWEDPLYEAVNGNKEAAAWLSNAGSSYYGSDNAIGAIYGRTTEGKSESDQMTEDEVAIFNYLYATQGKAAAHQYYSYLASDLYYRERKEQEAYWQQQARDNPVGSSIFSVAVSPMKGLAYLGQATDFIADGELTENAQYNKFSYIPSTIRETVPENWGAVGTFAYQTGMSMADFLLTTAITGGNQTAALTIMGSGAAADTTLAAKDRGLEDWQAFALGTVAGVTEALTEKASIDTLLNADLLKDNTLKYILKNALAEGSEEVASSTFNWLADIIVSQDRSEWMEAIEAYMDEGMTEDEAFARAMADQALSLGVDFLGGFISGGAMGGGGAVIGSINTQRIGNELGNLQMNDENIQSFIKTGLESDPETASYKIAVELQGKIQKGQKLSNYDLARLYQANMQAIQEEEAAEDLSGDSRTDTVAGEVTDPGRLSLPSVENDTQAPGLVTQNTQNGTQTQVNDTVLPDGVPLSIADQLRQEQAQNGGTQYERTYERAAGPATAQPAGELYLPGGASLPDGGSQWHDGESTGEQTGVLAGRARQAAPGDQARVDAARASVQRTNISKNLRTEKVSSTDLGLQNGTETKHLQIIPEEYWDDSMAAKAEQVHQETGRRVAYILGRMQVRDAKGNIFYAKGVNTGDRIIVQANNTQYTAEQIADHEAYHGMADPKNYGQLLSDGIVEQIKNTFSREEFDQVLRKYIDALSGIYDLRSARDGAEYEQRMNGIIEELLADAHAGMNMWGAGATKFTDTVNRFLDDNNISRKPEQDNGTEEPTGPPSDRYSFAGENANNANLDALARAKEMRSAGVADETIRQQTGWHTGMDGKWRWEIDDSGMEYSGRGDLGLRERRPEYARYRELLDKSNRYVLELSNEALTPEETAELQKLKDIWGGTFRKAGRITEDALPTDLLSDYVKHDDLFEAYPQLRKTRLRFAELPEGTRGQYDPEQDVITLSESLRGKPQDTLIHEIQHVIQKAEGFAQGSSPEFWEQVQKGEQPVRANDRRVAEAERKIQEIMDSLPPFVAGQFELHRHKRR